MNDYVADNGVVLTSTDDGSIRWHPGISQRRASEALREFFQAERDEALGRWREPENPDWICYGRGSSRDTVYVINEYYGLPYMLERDQVAYADSEFSAVAKRYFAAHPDVEPHKPWHDAKAGEYWLVTLEGAGPIPTTVGNYGENLYFTIDDDNLYCPTNDHRIQNAVRLTPEGNSDE